jgi:hypothetical protein
MIRRMRQKGARAWGAAVLLGFVLPPVTTSAAEPVPSLNTPLAWQIALERVGFSPGVIDGRIGGKTRLATREFQRVHGLPMTGKLDAATAAVLQPDPAGALGTYTVQAADLRQVGPTPKGWLAKSKLPRLGYASLTEVVAEKFHCSRALLAQLNPQRNLAQLAAGDTLAVPAVTSGAAAGGGRVVEINLSEKVVRVLNNRNELVGLFHCSIAADKAKRPAGQARVAVIAHDPVYVFDPRMWPEVRGVKRKLIIPPGPRNPVGLCWIGLSLRGYGIHGSPNPELIGKTGSHGCFRLANWDALRLSRMVRIGTPVRFTT